MPEQEAVKAVSIQAGSLRQRVKRRELHPRDVLEWLKTQPQASEEFITWLRNKATNWGSLPAEKEKVEEQPKVEQKPEHRQRKQRNRRGPRNEIGRSDATNTK